jgi:hypothetical protein
MPDWLKSRVIALGAAVILGLIARYAARQVGLDNGDFFGGWMACFTYHSIIRREVL